MTYNDERDGSDRTKTEVIVSDIKLQGGQRQERGYDDYPSDYQAPGIGGAEPERGIPDDDDIPF